MAKGKKIKLEKTPEIMGINNEPINQSIKNDEQNIPTPFKPIVNDLPNNNEILTYNNRVYVRLRNGMIKFADNGQVVLESELK